MANALLIVDVQNYFVNKKTKDLPLKIYKHATNQTYNFILFTQFINNTNSNFVKKLEWDKCFSSPDIDIHPDLAKLASENTIFTKTSYSAFKAPGLLDFLKDNSITDLNICGLDADSCILASAYEGFDLGLNITILPQLIACGTKKSLYDTTLEIVNRNIQKTTSPNHK